MLSFVENWIVVRRLRGRRRPQRLTEKGAYFEGNGTKRNADAGVDVFGLGCEDGVPGDSEDVVGAPGAEAGNDRGVVNQEPLVHI